MENKTLSYQGSFDPARLMFIRESLGISKAEASRRLGLSKMGYGRYENGQRTPSIQTIEYMAQQLHTSSDYLLGLTDNPSPDYFLISKNVDPELFELIELIQFDNTENASRLLQYYKSLKKTSE